MRPAGFGPATRGLEERRLVYENAVSAAWLSRFWELARRSSYPTIRGRCVVFAGLRPDISFNDEHSENPPHPPRCLSQVTSRAAVYLGKEVAAAVRIHPAKAGLEGADIVLVECSSHFQPVYLTDNGKKEFHIRFANTTRVMDVEEAANYIAQHWKAAAPAGV